MSVLALGLAETTVLDEHLAEKALAALQADARAHAANPNPASREVLLAVVQDAAAVDRLLAARGRGPLAAEDIAGLLPDAPPAVRLALTPRGQHYTVRAVGGVSSVRRPVEATLAAPGGVEPEIVAWRAVEG